MPAAWALRNAVERPSLFSQAAAITSTPSEIQFSTISFCFAGSELVGPSKSSSAPRSFAAARAPFSQATKYWFPLLFGSRAIVSFLPPAPASSDFLQAGRKGTAQRTASEQRKRVRFTGSWICEVWLGCESLDLRLEATAML